MYRGARSHAPKVLPTSGRIWRKTHNRFGRSGEKQTRTCNISVGTVVSLCRHCVGVSSTHESPASGFGLPPPSQLDTTTFFCSTTSARESPPCSRSLTPSPIPGKTTTQGALPRATPPLPPPSCAAVPTLTSQKASMTPVRCAAKRLPFHSGALHSSARAAFRVVNAAMSVIDTPFDPCHAETPPPFVPIFPKTHTRASARYPGSFSQV